VKTRSVLLIGYGLMGRVMGRMVGQGAAPPSVEPCAMPPPWAKVTGVVDTSAQALSTARADLGLLPTQVHTTLAAALRNGAYQAAVISTPSEHHYAQAAQAMRNGLHVLVAKPAVSTVSQFLKLRALEQSLRLKVAVGQQMRFNRHYRAVASFIGSGELGTVQRITLLNSKPRPDPLNLGQMRHPAMLEMACHHFDALISLVPRARPVAITAQGYQPRWSPYAANSTVDAMLEFSGGLRVLYHGGFDALAPYYDLRVEGAKGTLRVRGEHMSAPSGFEYEFAPAMGRFSPVDLESQVPEGPAWALYMQQWQAWLSRGREPSFSLRRNQPVFALLQAGMESIDRGRRIELASHRLYQALLLA
jgi:predicted dehydrogenase